MIEIRRLPIHCLVVLSQASAAQAIGAHQLRQIQRIIAYSMEHQILQFVDDTKQIFPKRRHASGRSDGLRKDACNFSRDDLCRGTNSSDSLTV